MSQKSKKIIFVQIMYCIFVMCLIFITKTYSKYTSFSEGERLFETANWKVKIENIDITKQKECNIDILLNTDDNKYVTNGKIAPGITANGTFTLDTSGSEVTIKYIITPGKIMYNEKEFSDFTIKMIKANNKILECENGEYTDIIELEHINELIEFTIVVEWQSNNDEEDTIKGIEAGDLSIPINIRVEQYCE